LWLRSETSAHLFRIRNQGAQRERAGVQAVKRTKV
jgi:hypothetical protein